VEVAVPSRARLPIATSQCRGLRIGEAGLEPASTGHPDQWSRHLLSMSIVLADFTGGAGSGEVSGALQQGAIHDAFQLGGDRRVALARHHLEQLPVDDRDATARVADGPVALQESR
jgi:hypothetical protein